MGCGRGLLKRSNNWNEGLEGRACTGWERGGVEELVGLRVKQRKVVGIVVISRHLGFDWKSPDHDHVRHVGLHAVGSREVCRGRGSAVVCRLQRALNGTYSTEYDHSSNIYWVTHANEDSCRGDCIKDEFLSRSCVTKFRLKEPPSSVWTVVKIEIGYCKTWMMDP